MNTRKFIYAVLFLLATSAFSQQVKAQVYPQLYWDIRGPLPNLYLFRANGTGIRTTYPTGSLSFAIPVHFRWGRRGDDLIIHYPTATDVFRLTGYNFVLDIQFRTGVGDTQALGPGPWYGCRNAVMPPVIRANLCPRA